jgi:hypothetical protein
MRDKKSFPYRVPSLSRRSFLVQGSLLAAGTIASGRVFPREQKTTPSAALDIASIERSRILRAAQRYLTEAPVTITSFTSPRSPGSKHDYFSEGDYWWPDPQNPNGPYVQRDGMSNPENFTGHRHALIRLSLQVPALAAAWMLTQDDRYATHAVKHLRAWFLDESTWMNPNLEHSQAIQGRNLGRGIGVIDTIHLGEVTRAITVLQSSRALTEPDHRGLTKWFAQYLAWLTTSAHGQEEREAKNNHGTCWVVQVAEFARFTGNHGLTDSCRDRFRTVLVPTQIAPDGSFPLELRRTKPYGYCLFNLDAMATVCQTLSQPQNNLWAYETADGRSMKKAMAWMFPFIANKKSWPLPPDVQYFDQWPVRQPSLLFAGLAFSQPDYLELWKTLDPDPTVEEIIRNYPVRQPLLWLSKPGA